VVLEGRHDLVDGVVVALDRRHTLVRRQRRAPLHVVDRLVDGHLRRENLRILTRELQAGVPEEIVQDRPAVRILLRLGGVGDHLETVLECPEIAVHGVVSLRMGSGADVVTMPAPAPEPQARTRQKPDGRGRRTNLTHRIDNCKSTERSIGRSF
jgi:hypothetical protein